MFPAQMNLTYRIAGILRNHTTANLWAIVGLGQAPLSYIHLLDVDHFSLILALLTSFSHGSVRDHETLSS